MLVVIVEEKIFELDLCSDRISILVQKIEEIVGVGELVKLSEYDLQIFRVILLYFIKAEVRGYQDHIRLSLSSTGNVRWNEN